MKKKPLRLTISFGQEYEDVFHYLKGQENTSKFICELIRKGMNNNTKEENLEEKVYKILLQYLENEHLSLNTVKPSKSSQSNSRLMDEEIDLLNDLFG